MARDGISEVNWVEKYMKQLDEDMQDISRDLKKINDMENRINARIDATFEVNDRKFDKMLKNFRNLVLVAWLWVGFVAVLVFVAMILLLSKLKIA